MTSAFEKWDPTIYEASPESRFTYPRPRPEVKLYDVSRPGEDPYPTNSWLESVITDRYPKKAQLPFFNCVPWYWAVDYATSSFSHDHCLTSPMTNTLTQGNILQIQNDYSIRVLSQGNAGLALTYHDDFCATFTSNNFDAYPCRGAVSCNYVLKQGALVVDFGPYTVIKSTITPTEVEVQTQRDIVTVNNYDLLKKAPQLLIEGTYYDGTDIAEGIAKVSVVINATPPQKGSGQSISNIVVTFATLAAILDPITLIPGVPSQGTLTKNDIDTAYNYTTSPAGSGVSESITLIITEEGRTDIKWTFVFFWNDAFFYKLNCDFTKTKRQLWNIAYSSVVTSVAGNAFSFSLTSSNPGRVQLTNVDSNLVPSQTAIIVKGSVQDFAITSDGIPRCKLVLSRLEGDLRDIVLYMPSHWLGMLNKIPSGEFSSIKNFIYGNLYPLTLSNNNSISIDETVLPGVKYLSVFVEKTDKLVTSTLINTANADAERYILQIPQSGPYQFGTIVGKMARIYSLFQVYGGTLAAESSVKKSIFKPSSAQPQPGAPGTGILTDQWLAGTNINNVDDWTTAPLGFMSPRDVFQILRDDIWCGVLTPADYLNDTFKGTPIGLRYASSNFGNSYYADHHFHWGYFFYILTSFAKLGINYYTGIDNNGIPTKSYAPQILELLKDVVNPVSDKFGWKVRHKDWYTGHSWASGVGDQIQRQNESMGESCNCYYSAYHLCVTLIADPNVTDRTELIKIRDCALSALAMEILALQTYYLNGSGKTATNSFQGSLAKTAGVGILFNNSKQCTLDWAPTPDSHNGRMLGVYGIHFLPFNQLVKTTLTSAWVETVAGRVSNIEGRPYSTPASLVSTLCEFRDYVPVLAPNEVVNDVFVKKDGVRFGAMGLKYLSFRPSQTGDNPLILLTPNVASSSYKSAQTRQNNEPLNVDLFHQTDSLTNTLYWLFFNGYLSGATGNQLLSADVPSISVNIDLPCGPAETLSLERLLAESSAKCEGKIGVPLVYLQICLDSGNSEVAQSFVQIYDEFCYNNARACISDKYKCCYLHAIEPSQLKLTRLTTDLNPALVTKGQGTTIHDKLAPTGFDANNFIFYAMIKLVFARILTGEFNLKYLTQEYMWLYPKLLRTRFCAAYSTDILLNPIFAGMDSLFI